MSFSQHDSARQWELQAPNLDIPIPHHYVQIPDLSIEFTATFSRFTPEYNTKNTLQLSQPVLL